MLFKHFILFVLIFLSSIGRCVHFNGDRMEKSVQKGANLHEIGECVFFIGDESIDKEDNIIKQVEEKYIKNSIGLGNKIIEDCLIENPKNDHVNYYFTRYTDS